MAYVKLRTCEVSNISLGNTDNYPPVITWNTQLSRVSCQHHQWSMMICSWRRDVSVVSDCISVLPPPKVLPATIRIPDLDLATAPSVCIFLQLTTACYFSFSEFFCYQRVVTCCPPREWILSMHPSTTHFLFVLCFVSVRTCWNNFQFFNKCVTELRFKWNAKKL